MEKIEELRSLEASYSSFFDFDCFRGACGAELLVVSPSTALSDGIAWDAGGLVSDLSTQSTQSLLDVCDVLPSEGVVIKECTQAKGSFFVGVSYSR